MNQILDHSGSPLSPSAQPSAGTANGSLDFVSLERGKQEFDEAKRHARRVRIAKIVMPVVGALIILAVGVALLIRQFFLPDLDLGAINLQDGKLVMENPNLNGFDKQKRPFSLTALKAIQDADQPKRVELIDISAKLPMNDTVFANVKAGNGVYDAEEKTLVLTQSVNVVTTDGTQINLVDADVDIAAGVLKTQNPVSATSEKADISSESLEVTDNGKRMVFVGGVRMTLRPNELEKSDP